MVDHVIMAARARAARKVGTCLLMVSALVVAMLGITNPANAVSTANRTLTRPNTGTWAIQPTPKIQGPKNGTLYGVACTSASACTAVGSYENGSGVQATLAQVWNGTSWAVQTTHNPAGSVESFLYGVACTSASACTAVGNYENRSGVQATLAQVWNGTSWAVQTTHNPAGSVESFLTAVSCTSASDCTAVGYYENSSGDDATLAEVWNGTAWSIQSTPNPSGSTDSLLDAVACTSADACTGVGYSENSSLYENTLAETWNGTTWSVQTTPNPSGSTDSQLNAVACTSADACTAVGYYENSSYTLAVTLAETWNGSSWSIQSTPNPGGTTYSFFSSVSCTSASTCTAVGNYENSSGVRTALAQAWNGTTWAVQTTPNGSGASDNELYGVSCTLADACTAVGEYDNRENARVTLAETWDGTSWSVQTTPKVKGSSYLSELDSVSCTSASTCTAVGYYVSSSDSAVALAEKWNGTKWSVQTTPNVTDSTNSYLGSVACTSASSCTAVGQYENTSGDDVTLAEAWNGTAWSVQTTPNPSGATSSYLGSVSCTSANACAAVGYDENSPATPLTLAEAWNGTSWSIETTPTPTGATKGALSSVSCTSASACTAVGYYVSSSDTYGTLAEVWNGSSWSVQTTPKVKGSSYLSELDGVSCTSASACTAVGYYENSPATYVTLAEAWNGTSWSVQSTPKVDGSIFSDLDGLSCTSASVCTAVGSSGGSEALVETES